MRGRHILHVRVGGQKLMEGGSVIGEGTGREQSEFGRLLDRFLAERSERTRRAYTADLLEFARLRGREPAAAVADLLAGGPQTGRQILSEYVAELRQEGSAPATIDRRVATVRALARLAHEAGLVSWSLEVPGEDEIARAMERRALGGVPYLLPRDANEIDRLDLQHYALQEALGANYLAPVESPEVVLDVGCGTGQWGFEICEAFASAMVIGVDLAPGKAGRPQRYSHVRANLLQGLPFADGRFDFVHQRLLFLAVPVAAWPDVVSELVRVARPGGWVELVEPPIGLRGAGPALDELLEVTLAMGAARGLDTTSTVFSSLDGYLRDAGLTAVTRREEAIPVGEWGGYVGSLMATDFRAAFTRLCEVLQAAGRIAAEDSYDLLQRAQREYETRRVSSAIAVAYGRKPG
jgi:SAM-dependent methyltransferase